MNKEEFSEIANLHGQLCSLEELIDKMKGCSPSLGMEIKVKTGYSDMGLDITRSISMDGDIALKCFYAIGDVLKNSLIESEKAFKKIAVNGL